MKVRHRILLYFGQVPHGPFLLVLNKAGVNGVMIPIDQVFESEVKRIRSMGWELGVVVGALPGGSVCPASLKAREHLEKNLMRVLEYKPDIIWLDHLRFEGRWETVKTEMIGFHRECKYCRKKDRVGVIRDLAIVARDLVSTKSKLGYYAVPLVKGSDNGWLELLGQDHKLLCRVFDYVSPMLYYRMIGRPIGYISRYVLYLEELSVKARVLPIIQVKDMPDSISDKLSIAEVESAIELAIKPPSCGVALFTWEKALETNKSEDILRILRSLKQDRGEKDEEA